jgi:hypothetical protein
MKEKTKDRICGMFSARAENRFYIAVGIYIAAFFIVQAARFIIQNV